MSEATVLRICTAAIIINILGFGIDILGAISNASKGDVPWVVADIVFATVALFAIGLCIRSRRELLDD